MPASCLRAKVVALARACRSAYAESYCAMLTARITVMRPKRGFRDKCCPVDHLRAVTDVPNTYYWVLSAAASYFGSRVFAFLLIPEGVDDATKTDTIVVLTGGSLRLQTGLTLKRRPRHVFVSASNAAWTCANCCASPEHRRAKRNVVQLGHVADDAAGNGRNAARMAAQKFQTLRLVTAAYHMPRSQWNSAMPCRMLKSWSRSSRPGCCRSGGGGEEQLSIPRYSKYLIARTRHIFERLRVATNFVFFPFQYLCRRIGAWSAFISRFAAYAGQRRFFWRCCLSWCRSCIWLIRSFWELILRFAGRST